MIYFMEKVPDTLEAWMNKAINFHSQKAHIIALKRGHSLSLFSFPSNSHSTRDPNASDVTKRDTEQMNVNLLKHKQNPRETISPN